MKEEDRNLEITGKLILAEIKVLEKPESFRNFLKNLIYKNTPQEVVNILVIPPLLAFQQGFVKNDNLFLKSGIHCLRLFSEIKSPITSLITSYLLLSFELFEKGNTIESTFRLTEYDELIKLVFVLKRELESWPDIEN